jgi:hypothetical protein
MDQQPFLASEQLKDVRYEIRGPLARRAYEEALDYGREYPGRARAAELLMSVVDAPTDGPDREASRK